MAGFSDLIVWKEAASLATNVLEAAQNIRGPAAASVADQLIRAANSIHANIAEGYGRGLTADAVRFLRFAKASADELESHLRVAALGKRIPQDVADKLIDQVRRVGYLIYRFSQSVERRRKK